MAKMKNVVIEDWFIQIYPGNALVILGIRPGDTFGKFWRSSPIVKRITAKVVETHSGSRYTLKGNLNKVYVEEASDPLAYRLDSELVDKFLRGFPINWKSYLDSFCDKKYREKPAEVVKDQSVSSMEAEGKRSTRASESLRGQVQAPKGEQTPKEIIQAPKRKAVLRSTKGGKDAGSKVVSEKAAQKSGVLDDSRYLDGLPDMKYSSNGRLIKAPNPNVSYECDMLGNFIGLSPQLFSPKFDLSRDSVTPKAKKSKKKKDVRQAPVAKGVPVRDSKAVVQDIHVHQGEVGKKRNVSGRTPLRKAKFGIRKPEVLLQNLQVKPRTRSTTGRQAPSEVEAPSEVVDKRESKGKISAPVKRGAAKKPVEIAQGRKKKEKESNDPFQNSPLKEDAEMAAEDVMNKTPIGNEKKWGKNPKVVLQEDKRERKGKTSAPVKRGAAKKPVEIAQGRKKKEKVSNDPLQNSPVMEGAEMAAEDVVNETPIGNEKKRGRNPKVVLQNLPGKQEQEKKEGNQDMPFEGTKNPAAKKLRLGDQSNILLQNLRGKEAGKKERATSSRSDSNLILAKRGTLKRTRQIQEAVRELDAGYSDDAFADATPLKKAKLQFQNIDVDDSCSGTSEDADVDVCGDESPVTTWRQRLGAPLPVTPDLGVYDFDEPMVIRSDERKAAAQIAYRIKKKRPMKPQVKVQKQQKKGKQAKSAFSKALTVATHKLGNLAESDSEDGDAYMVGMISDDGDSCEEDIFDTL